MKMKKIHKALLAVGSLACLGCYFLPFIKIGLAGLFAAESTAASGFDMILGFVTHSGEIASIERIAGSTAFVVIVFFMIPFFLAVINIAFALALKPKAAGIILTVTNFIGFIINLALRLFLAMPTDDYFIRRYDEIFLYQPAAYAIIALFFICMCGSIALIITSKDKKTAENNFNSVNYQDNAAAAANGFVPQNNGAYSPAYQEPQQNPAVVSQDAPTSYVPNYSDDNVTVRLDPSVAERNAFTDIKKRGSIVCTEGMYKSGVFPIEEGEEIFIGRDKAQCNIVLDASLTYIGRNHCSLIYLRDGSYLIKVYSSNGVIINNKGILKESARVKLPKGTVITLGKRDISFELN